MSECLFAYEYLWLCLCECVCVCVPVCACESECVSVCVCVFAVCVKADLCIQTSTRHLAEDFIRSDLNFLLFGSRVIKEDEFPRGAGRVLRVRSR